MGHDEDYTAYVSAKQLWLRRVAYLLCQDWSRADDLVQTTMTRLYVHWRRARKTENLDGYTRTILVRVFLSEQRSGWRRWVSLAHDLPDPPGPAADNAALVDLRAALAELPPRRRAAIVLRFYCDMSIEETAAALGCSAGTVKSQTARALATLRHALADHQESYR